MKEDISVKPVTRQQIAPFILDIHYAGRFPSVSFAFGLFLSEILIGVITYGTPPSASLRSGLLGPEYKDKILELNRLCLKNNIKNHASFLISASLKMIPNNKAIISFADISQGHIGTVYQASSFLYCGLSAKRTDWAIKGKEHLHGQTIADEFRGVKNRSQAMRDKYGSDFYLKPRSRKHRYVKFIGSKGFRAQALKSLRYPIELYPKKNN